MKKHLLFHYDPNDDGQGGGTPTPPDPQPAPPDPQPPTPVPPQQQSWQGPSQEEWQQTQAAIRQMASFFEPDGDEDQYEADLPEEVQRYIQQSIAPYAPHLQTAVQEAGTRRMNEIFDSVEQEVGGKFDRKLAERVAHGFLPEIGDPVEATKQAAKFAFELKKQYGQEAVDEYKASLKRGHGADPDVSGGGEPGTKKFKTADEVIEHWSAQTEV